MDRALCAPMAPPARLVGAAWRGGAASAPQEQPLSALRQPLLARADDEPLPPSGTRAGLLEAAETRTTLRIGGMTCPKCVASVQKALEAVHGVRDVFVDLESCLAQVSGAADAASLLDAISMGGRTATVLKREVILQPDAGLTVLRVSGMTCAHCVTSVQRALEAVTGVERAEVDLQSGTAQVYGCAPLNALASAMEATGKSATVLASDALKQETIDMRNDQTSMIYWFSISGMTCNGCSEKVAQALSRVQGVASAVVDLELKIACVELRYPNVPLEKLTQAVSEVGRHNYSASPLPASAVNASDFGMRKREAGPKVAPGSQMVVLAIEGMSCTACARKVEAAVGALDGVASVWRCLLDQAMYICAWSSALAL